MATRYSEAYLAGDAAAREHYVLAQAANKADWQAAIKEAIHNGNPTLSDLKVTSVRERVRVVFTAAQAALTYTTKRDRDAWANGYRSWLRETAVRRKNGDLKAFAATLGK